MYGAYISEKGPVLNVHIPRDIMCLKERDPASVALEKSVNIKMNQAIESILPNSKLQVYDFYNAKQHTEPAIIRARKVSLFYPNTQHTS